MPIGELATELGVSRRHLSRRFHHQVGLPPKNLARVLRFRRAVRLNGERPPWSWSGIAAECGYYVEVETDRLFALLDGLAVHAAMRPEQATPDRIRAALSAHLRELGRGRRAGLR